MFNPKSMTRQELLGQIDLDTREWSDGLLTHIAQSVYNETAGKCSSHLAHPSDQKQNYLFQTVNPRSTTQYTELPQFQMCNVGSI